MVLVLTRADVESVVGDECVDIIEQAHALLALGEAVQPARPVLADPQSDATLIPMLAAIGPDRLGGVKLLADVPGNQGGRTPVQQSTLTLVNLDNGVCEAFIHGAAITLYRTAAASAVATRHLSREDSRVLGLVGAGAQARTHVAALRRVRPVDTVLVWSRTPRSAKLLAEELAETGLVVHVLDSPEDVVRGCDVLCTLTPSSAPVVHGEWFSPGLHVNAVGAPPRREYRELDTTAIQRARVVVDDFATTVQESGDVMIPVEEGAITPDHFATELGEVVVGRAPGRLDAQEITVYNSVGVGVQDIALGRVVLDRARAAGLGIRIDLSGGPGRTT
jgi:alanine dehydrogenase